jgi:hypothetical protein
MRAPPPTALEVRLLTIVLFRAEMGMEGLEGGWEGGVEVVGLEGFERLGVGGFGAGVDVGVLAVDFVVVDVGFIVDVVSSFFGAEAADVDDSCRTWSRIFEGI